MAKRKLTKIRRKISDEDNDRYIISRDISDNSLVGDDKAFQLYLDKFLTVKSIFKDKSKKLNGYTKVDGLFENKVLDRDEFIELDIYKTLTEITKNKDKGRNSYYNSAKKVHGCDFADDKVAKRVDREDNCYIFNIPEKEKKLMVNRCYFFEKFDNLVSEINKCFIIKDKKVSCNDYEPFIKQIIELLTNAKKGNEAEILDINSKITYKRLILSSCRYDRKKIANFIVKYLDNKTTEKIIKNQLTDYIVNFVEANYNNITDYNNSLSTSIKIEDVVSIHSQNFGEYKITVERYVNLYDIKTISQLLKNETKNKGDKITRGDLFEILNRHYKSVTNEFYFKNNDDKSKLNSYFFKHINRYLKDRASKYINLMETDKSKCKYVFEENMLKIKLTDKLLNKWVYHISHKRNLNLLPVEKIISKSNYAIASKLCTVSNETVFIISKNHGDLDIFETKFTGDVKLYINEIIERIDRDRFDSIFNPNVIKGVSIKNVAYSIAYLRNLTFHQNVINQSKQGKDFFWNEKDTSYLNIDFKNIINGFSKDIEMIRKQMINKQIMSNNCLWFVEEEKLISFISSIKLNNSKAAILPRFDKIYGRLANVEGSLFFNNLELYKDTTCVVQFSNSQKYLFSLLYSHNFHEKIPSLISKDDSIFDYIIFKGNISIEEIKANLMAICNGDESKTRKMEQKFVSYISELFSKYLLDSKIQKDIFKIYCESEAVLNYDISTKLVISSIEFGEINDSLSKVIILCSFILRKARVNNLIGDLKKYQQILMSTSSYKYGNSLFDEYEINNLINILDTIKDVKDSNLLNDLISSNMEETIEFKNIFDIVNYDNAFKKPEDVIYSYLNKENVKVSQAVLIDISNSNDENQIVAFSKLLDIVKYGKLDKIKKIYKDTLLDSKIDYLELLEELSSYKSMIVQDTCLNDIKDLIKDSKEGTVISAIQLEKNNLFNKCKKQFYSELERINLQEDQKNINESKFIDKTDLNNLLKLNNHINRYNFIMNIIYLNQLTKVYNVIENINSRVVSWGVSSEAYNKEKKYNRDYNFNNNLDMSDFRHINYLSNEQFTKDMKISNLFSKNKDTNFILPHNSFLTNLYNDSTVVMLNIFSKLNLDYDENTLKFKSKNHKIFSKDNLRMHQFDNFIDLQLLCLDEVKFWNSFIKVNFNDKSQ